MKNHKAYPYLVEFFSALKHALLMKIIKSKSLDLRELFDYSNYEKSDIYKPIVFRDILINNNTESIEDLKSPFLSILEYIDNLLPENDDGEYAMSTTEFEEIISKEFMEMGNELFIDYYSLNYFLQDYKYVVEDINFDDLEEEEEGDKEKAAKALEGLMKTQIDPKEEYPIFKFEDIENRKGYYIPIYNLFRWNENYWDIEYEYNKISKGIKSDKISVFEATVSVGAYRDLLAKQLDRQIEQLEEINEVILDQLNVLFSETYSNFNKVLLHDDYEHLPIEEDMLYIISILKNIYECVTLNIENNELYELHEKDISKIPYASNEMKDSCVNILHHFNLIKKPILEVSRKLALKHTICESLLEDFFMRDSIKTFEEFSESFKAELTREKIIKKTFFYKDNGMKWEHVFETIRAWLLNEHGLDEEAVKDKFDFNIKNIGAFNRFMNKHKHPWKNRNK